MAPPASPPETQEQEKNESTETERESKLRCAKHVVFRCTNSQNTFSDKQRFGKNNINGSTSPDPLPPGAGDRLIRMRNSHFL